MKIILLIFTAFLLASCQNEPTVEPLSNATNVYSTNTSKVQIDKSVIYIYEGLTVSELFDMFTTIDNSTQTYRATANDGSIKTKDKLYEYDQIIVTSESGLYQRTYSIQYIIE
jgi:lipopolysaccharide export system protein LptC